MSAGTVYLLGIAVVAAAGAGLAVTVSKDVRSEVVGALLTALAIQAPLGWWTLRSIGTSRFQLVWSLGMLIRITVLLIAGFALVPALDWQLGPALGTLVAAMFALLIVEAAAAVREHSWGKG